jgi:hypothetical protein
MELSDERLQEIFNVHNGYTGHPGVERTVRMLRARGTSWKGATADVAQFIKRCPTCCASRLKLQYAPVSPSSLRLHAPDQRGVERAGAANPLLEWNSVLKIKQYRNT